MKQLARWGLIVAIALVAGAAGADEGPAAGTDPSRILADVVTWAGEAAPPAQLLLKNGDQIAFMGDSITQFGGYVRLTQYVLTTDYPDLKLTYVNAGVSGQKAENMEPRFAKDMKLGAGTTWAFISVGINDVWHRVGAPHDPAVLEAYRANVTKMVDAAQAAGARVVLLAPTVITEDPNAEGNKRLLLYVDAEKQIAAEKNCALVDLHGMFRTAIANKPAEVKLTSDGVHMARYGDALMALGVLRALGVPDATCAGTDPVPALRVGALRMTLLQAAAALEVPPARFFKPELIGFVGF